MNIKSLLVQFLVFLLIIALLGSFDKDTTDSEDGRSGMSLYTDNLTGCHYLGTLFGGLTPRLDREGKHVCEQTLTNF